MSSRMKAKAEAKFADPDSIQLDEVELTAVIQTGQMLMQVTQQQLELEQTSKALEEKVFRMFRTLELRHNLPPFTLGQTHHVGQDGKLIPVGQKNPRVLNAKQVRSYLKKQQQNKLKTNPPASTAELVRSHAEDMDRN